MACNTYCYIQWRIQGRGPPPTPPPPPILYQTKVRRAEKKFFDTTSPLVSGSGWPPLPPLSEGLDPLLIYRRKRRLAISHHQKNEENHTIRTCSFISCSCCCNWVNSWGLISGLALAFDWQGAVAKAKEKMTLVTSRKKRRKRKEKKRE